MAGQSLKINGKTQLAGLIGWPVSHSFSPVMHNAAAADLGLNLAYVPLPVHPVELEQAVSGLPGLGFIGANVTVPFKEKIIPFLDDIDPATKAIGAVNTLVIQRPQYSKASSPSDKNSSSRIGGYNTDWSGFLAHLEQYNLDLPNMECWILGAGGSSRAVTYGLASLGASVSVFSRRHIQSKQLVADLSPHFPSTPLAAHSWEAIKNIKKKTEPILIVNTTPLGMVPNVDISPWPDGLSFPRKAFVYDLVYNPAETKLLSQAKASGCRSSTGLGMLIHQAAQSFALWTGLQPNIKIMAEAIE